MRALYKILSFTVFGLSGVFAGFLAQGSAGADNPIAKAVSRGSEPRSVGEVRSVVLQTSSPTYQTDLVRVIDASRETIRIYTDRLLLRPVLESLQRALQRGVSVEIALVDSPQTKQLVNLWIPQNLGEASVWIVSDQNSPTFLIVDGATAIVTSLSLSSADRINREVIAVVTRETPTIADLTTQFAKMKAQAL